MSDDKQDDVPPLLHRDDLDMDVAESVVEALKARFPGMEVVCAGDDPNPPQEVREAVERFDAFLKIALIEGRCQDCGKVMPGIEGFKANEDWEPAYGWQWFTDHTGTLVAWQCPECDAADQDDNDQPTEES